jgi:2-polyprenyl-3-methyl-5-hydroxy-6-metoxy-1,4-benzoquinol methylase
MRISEGIEENGVVVGNNYDKYGSKNPIVRWVMKGFSQSLSQFVEKVRPESIHEIGCGEGYWVIDWTKQGINARGSDFSEAVVQIARDNAKAQSITKQPIFTARSIYDVEANLDSADLIVCCEVLEHLEYPEAGLEALQRIASNYLIISVPREPLWCALNVARGKYITSFGNTPGHIQHWSSNKFTALVSKYFDVIEVEKPLPWTMLLCKAKS